LNELSSEFALYGTQLRVEPLGGRDPAEVWRQAVARRRPPVETFELAPGVPGMTSPDGHGLLIEGLQVRDGTALWLLRDTTPEKVSVARKLLAGIVERFSLGGGRAFCLGEASIDMRSLSETAHLRLAGPSKAFTIDFQSQTITQPVSTAQTLDEELASGTVREVLRERRREVAGLPGLERWITYEVPGEPLRVRLTWAFEGEPRSSLRPSVSIYGFAPASERAGLEAAWEQVLGSLRPLR